MKETEIEAKMREHRGVELRSSILQLEIARLKRQEKYQNRTDVLFMALFLEATQKDSRFAIFDEILLQVLIEHSSALEGLVNKTNMDDTTAKALVMIWKSVLDVMHIAVPESALEYWMDK